MKLGFLNLLVAAPLVCLVASPASAIVKVVTSPIYNEASPGDPFTPTDPLGSILNEPLVETKAVCGSVGNCTYDFTFTIADAAPGDGVSIQLQAAAIAKGSSVAQVLHYTLESGMPGAGTLVGTSGPVDTIGQVIDATVFDGDYFVQVLGSDVKVSGEVGSGSLTVTAVPEVSTWLMMLAGFAGLGFAGYRRGKSTERLIA